MDGAGGQFRSLLEAMMELFSCCLEKPLSQWRGPEDAGIFSPGVLPSCYSVKKPEQSQSYFSLRLSAARLWTSARCLGGTGSWALS